MTDQFADQPVMYGEQIWMRPIELRDALAISQAVGNEGTAAYLGTGVPVSEEAFRNWILSIGSTELVWAVCRADQQDAIGTARIGNIDLQHGVAETGMGLLYENDCGQGLGQEIKALLLDFAFSVMGLQSLKSTIDARNTRSQRSVEKSGFTLAGRLTAEFPLGMGNYADMFVYQLRASDWSQRD